MEIGIDSFAAVLPDPKTGKPPSGEDRMADLFDEIALADNVGLDVFGVGEHHRAFSVQRPCDPTRIPMASPNDFLARRTGI